MCIAHAAMYMYNLLFKVELLNGVPLNAKSDCLLDAKQSTFVAQQICSCSIPPQRANFGSNKGGTASESESSQQMNLHVHQAVY